MNTSRRWAILGLVTAAAAALVGCNESDSPAAVIKKLTTPTPAATPTKPVGVDIVPGKPSTAPVSAPPGPSNHAVPGSEPPVEVNREDKGNKYGQSPSKMHPDTDKDRGKAD